MKQVTAVIKPHRVRQVIDALEALPHFPGYSLLEGRGQGRGHGPGGVHQIGLADIENPPAPVLIILCADAFASRIVDTVRQAAHTGLPGDGIVWTVTVDQLTRIRTGETGEDAV
ncbi:MAG: P-II family nitrogen regulator [Methylohalobius crimeensis]